MTPDELAHAPMLEALASNGPHPGHADKLMLFGRFVGTWECQGSFFHRDGTVRETHRGEWHFGWVLEGRAVQDVLISPPRQARDAGSESFEYGTTLRIYDPRIDAWRVTFASAVTGTVINLIGRDHGGDIWLDGRGPDDRLYRWVFSEIADTSVRWEGFVASGDGGSWVRDEEILLSRRDVPSDARVPGP